MAVVMEGGRGFYPPGDQTANVPPQPVQPSSKSVHTLTDQLTYLKCAHAHTEPSYQSGYRAQNITHAK